MWDGSEAFGLPSCVSERPVFLFFFFFKPIILYLNIFQLGYHSLIEVTVEEGSIGSIQWLDVRALQGGLPAYLKTSCLLWGLPAFQRNSVGSFSGNLFAIFGGGDLFSYLSITIFISSLPSKCQDYIYAAK